MDPEYFHHTEIVLQLFFILYKVIAIAGFLISTKINCRYNFIYNETPENNPKSATTSNRNMYLFGFIAKHS